MLTFFTSLKSFRGQIAVIQRNAIKSWTLLRPKCEIILLGDEDGVAEAAREFGTKHIPDIERSKCGIPLVNSIFKKAQNTANNSLMCYVNPDIILQNNFLDAVKRVSFHKFLMIGRRRDIDINKPWDFMAPDWESKLREYAKSAGKPHRPYGSDYFVFPRETRWEMPPFVIGHPRYDNWIIWKARSLKMPVIDASKVVNVIHQNHCGGCASVQKSKAARENMSLAGGWGYIYTILDSTHVMTRDAVLRVFGYRYRHLRWVLPTAIPGMRSFLRFLLLRNKT
ncbi:MAG: hypothetical protein HQ549_06550 [Candidatus Omnitrophica bacterium]|nr:hypothetical protein [Candidatus Omnitrophota bacterium]